RVRAHSGSDAHPSRPLAMGGSVRARRCRSNASRDTRGREQRRRTRRSENGCRLSAERTPDRALSGRRRRTGTSDSGRAATVYRGSAALLDDAATPFPHAAVQIVDIPVTVLNEQIPKLVAHRPTVTHKYDAVLGRELLQNPRLRCVIGNIDSALNMSLRK